MRLSNNKSKKVKKYLNVTKGEDVNHFVLVNTAQNDGTAVGHKVGKHIDVHVIVEYRCHKCKP